MFKHIDKPRVHLFLIIPLLAAFGCDVPLETYQPRNQDEKDVLAVLIQYQDARNRFDMESLLPLLDDEGEFTFQCGMMVSKSRLREMLPAFWAELASGNSAVIPIVHECINGDYFRTGRLNNPQIAIRNDRAQATVLFTEGVCRVLLYVTMRRENGEWMITRTEWGES